MYRKPKFLEELHAIREEMSRESDYDVDLFAEMVRSGGRQMYRSKNGASIPMGDQKPIAYGPESLAPRRIGRISNIPGVSAPGTDAKLKDEDNQSNRRSDADDE